jgi:hypothetical protein
MVKKTIVSMVMSGVAIFALASSGGSEDKSTAKASSGLSMVKTNTGFSLRAGRMYKSPLSIKGSKSSSDNLVLTYRKGNTFYILPKLPTAPKITAGKSNLSLIQFKVGINR